MEYKRVIEKRREEEKSKISKEKANRLQNKESAHLLRDNFKPVISGGGGIVDSIGVTHSIQQTAPEACFLLSDKKETFTVFPVVVTSGPFFLQ